MPSRRIIVGATVTPLLSYNPRRTTVAVFNEAATVVFIGEDETDLLTEGSPIQAGGAITFVAALGDTPDMVMFGINAAGGADVRILEQFGDLPPLTTPAARASGSVLEEG